MVAMISASSVLRSGPFSDQTDHPDVDWITNGPGTDLGTLPNTDGDAAADDVIGMLGVHAVDAGWFVL
jgi:hypothetical protein